MASLPSARLPRLALGRSFVALRTRNYRLYFLGQLVSQSGNWMQITAQAWLVLDLTGSPLALGTVTALQFLPVLVFSLVGGVIADRFPKREFLLVTQGLEMVQALALWALVATDVVQLWHVYVLAAMLGITMAMDMPARRSMPSEMVAREHVLSAVALNTSLFNAARVVGPSLGGLAIVTVGVAGCFLLNGLSFVAVLVALAMMRPAEFFVKVPEAKGSIGQQLGEGFSYVGRTPPAAFTLILLASLGIFGYNFNVLLPLLARYALDVGALGFGGLNSAVGIGAVVGGLLVARQGRASQKLMVAAALVYALFLASLAVSPWYQLTLVLLFIDGLAGVAFSASANTNLQLLSPDNLRGRVMAIYNLVFIGIAPVGATISGVVAEQWDVRVALGANAAGCVLGILVGLGYLRVVRGRAALRDRGEAGA